MNTISQNKCRRRISRLAVDMDIHGYIDGYIHVWISDLSHPVDIMLAHLLIKLATYMLCLSRTFPRLSFLVFIFSFIYVI